MKNNLTPRERKRLARLKREVEELNDLGYKHDGDDGWGVAGERLNSRWYNKRKEIERLKPNYNEQRR